MTPIQEMIIKSSQRGLDDPTNISGIIIGSFNPFTSTAIYHYSNYQLWYKPLESKWVVWKNEKFCFSFERDTKVIDMIERMDNELLIRRVL